MQLCLHCCPLLTFEVEQLIGERRTFFFLNFSVEFVFAMSEKRKAEDNETENDDEWIGPLPSDAAPPKKQRGWFFYRLTGQCKHFNINSHTLTINFPNQFCNMKTCT